MKKIELTLSIERAPFSLVGTWPTGRFLITNELLFQSEAKTDSFYSHCAMALYTFTLNCPDKETAEEKLLQTIITAICDKVALQHLLSYDNIVVQTIQEAIMTIITKKEN